MIMQLKVHHVEMQQHRQDVQHDDDWQRIPQFLRMSNDRKGVVSQESDIEIADDGHQKDGVPQNEGKQRLLQKDGRQQQHQHVADREIDEIGIAVDVERVQPFHLISVATSGHVVAVPVMRRVDRQILVGNEPNRRRKDRSHQQKVEKDGFQNHCEKVPK